MRFAPSVGPGAAKAFMCLLRLSTVHSEGMNVFTFEWLRMPFISQPMAVIGPTVEDPIN